MQQGPGPAHLNQIASAPYTAGKPIPWTTATLVPQLVGTYQDSGPFPLTAPSQLQGLVADAISKLGMPVLLFDSDRNGGRHVFAFATGLAPMQVMLPGNATLESRISVATSAAPPRFFWISNTDAGSTDAGIGAAQQLVTTTAMSNTATPVSITLEDRVRHPPPRLAPWVTPGGDPAPLLPSPDLRPEPRLHRVDTSP